MWSIAGMPIVERNHALVVNMLLWTSLALLVICLRLFTRAIVVKRLGWDDWLMTGALVFSIGFLIAAMYQIKYGLGQPVNLATLNSFLAALYATVPCYNMAQTLYKLSITTQSYRLFATARAQKIMKVLIGWILVCGIMSVSGSLFYCRPIPKAWDDSVPGQCVNRSNLNYAIAGFNILNDVALLLIPVPFLLTLQIAKKQRIVLICVFACGAFVTVVSIIRLKALYDNLSGPINLQPVTGVDIALWSDIEINVAIICGSVPALKAFVSRVILRIAHEGSSSTPYAISGSRKQSQAIRSTTDDGGEGSAGLRIAVQQSIEMKTYNADDTGSEKELIDNDAFSPALRNQARISTARMHQNPV